MTPTRAAGQDVLGTPDRPEPPKDTNPKGRALPWSIGIASPLVNFSEPQTAAPERQKRGRVAANRRPLSLRLLLFLTRWIAIFCGFFGVLVISTHLITGIISLAVCAVLLWPRGTRS